MIKYDVRLNMKLVREHINEKFTENSDPVKDLGIGPTKLIIKWISDTLSILEENVLNFISINDNYEIDCKYGMAFYNIQNLPSYIRFNKIERNFKIDNSSMFTSLKGLPKEIGGDFIFTDNGINPTEEQIRKNCNVGGYVILISEHQFQKKLQKEKYKKLGPVNKRSTPKIDVKERHIEQKWSRGYLLWKILDYIDKAGDKGRGYSEIVKFDNNFKDITYKRRTLSSGVFNSLDRYTSYDKRKLTHKYVLNNSGKVYLEHYRKAFDDGIDYSKGPVKESLNEKFSEDSDPIEDLGIGTRKKISKWLKKNSEKDDDDNALAECAAHGKTEWVKFLIRKGADVHYANNYAIRWAAHNGHTEIVKMLEDHIDKIEAKKFR